MTETSTITISPRAVRRINELVKAEAALTLFRVSVEGGGCSGFQYRFDLVTETAPDDVLVERDGARVVVDPVSLGFVAGSELDFVDDLIGAQFKLNNPNVTAVVRLRHQLLGLTVASLLRVSLCHGRACPGHPRLSRPQPKKFVDARHKAGHDEGVGLR